MRITHKASSILLPEFPELTSARLETCSGISGNERFLITFRKHGVWEVVKRTHPVLSVCVQCDLWLMLTSGGMVDMFSTVWQCWHSWLCTGGMGAMLRVLFKCKVWIPPCPFPFQISSRCAPSLRTSNRMGRALIEGGGNLVPWLLLCPQLQHWPTEGPLPSLLPLPFSITLKVAIWNFTVFCCCHSKE